VSRPPIFGTETERWSLGSVVCVRYWQRRPDGGADELDEIVQVVGLRPDGESGWIVTVSRGELLDLSTKLPKEFPHTAIEWLP